MTPTHCGCLPARRFDWDVIPRLWQSLTGYRQIPCLLMICAFLALLLLAPATPEE